MRGSSYIWMGATACAYLLGIGTGILFTKEHMRRKYKQKYETDISSAREAFRNDVQRLKEQYEQKEAGPVKNPESVVTPEERTAYLRLLQERGYSADEVADGPYIIPPDEFGDREDYETCSLTWYADGVLTDENDCEIPNVEETIGRESLNHFGEYEEDAVYVRNDARRCDYEILFDQRNYTDVLGDMPPM